MGTDVVEVLVRHLGQVRGVSDEHSSMSNVRKRCLELVREIDQVLDGVPPPPPPSISSKMTVLRSCCTCQAGRTDIMSIFSGI